MHSPALRLAMLLTGTLMVSAVPAQPDASDPDDEAQTLVIVASSRTVDAQQLAKDFTFDGDANEWSERPATDSVETPFGPATIWIAEGEDGLIVAGKLQDLSADAASSVDTPDPPSIAAELASVASVRLPLIYVEGHHGALRQPGDCGEDEFGSGNFDVAKCRAWVSEQLDYRRRLSAMFLRRTAPGDNLRIDAFPFLAEDPQQHDIANEYTERDPIDVKWFMRGGVRTFELAIPWTAMPAADDLRLSAVYLALHLGLPQQQELASKFWRVVLPAAREYRLTRCGTHLLTAHQGEALKGFYLPRIGSTLESTFAFIPEELYAPYGRAPRLASTHYLDEEVSAGRYLCAPFLAYSDGSGRTEFPNRDAFALQHPEDGPAGEVHADWNGVLQWREIDDGNLLVRSGPTEQGSMTGRGQCGACPRASLAFWYIERESMAFRLAYDAFYILNSADEEKVSITVSDDWRRVDIDDVLPTVQTGPDDKPTVVDEHSKIHVCLASGSREYAPCAEESASAATP